jgi:hypothetical protein
MWRAIRSNSARSAWSSATMPAFQLDPDQIGDLLAYLTTLE